MLNNSTSFSICLICELKINKSLIEKHYNEIHNLTSEQVYNIKNLNCNKNCLFCGTKLKFKRMSRGYGKYCGSDCRKVANGKTLGNWAVESGHLKSVSSKGGKIGGKVGGKISHQLHPELFKELGIKNIKKANEKLTFEQRSSFGKKMHQLYPGLAKKTAEETHKKYPDLRYRMGKSTHQKNPGLAARRNKDPNDKFGQRFYKRDYTHNNIRMKSSWEVEFARLCDKNNIKWEYEPKTQKLPNGRWCLIDFFLPKENLWVEIKPKCYQSEEILNRGKNLSIKYIVLDKKNFGEFFNV